MRMKFNRIPALLVACVLVLKSGSLVYADPSPKPVQAAASSGACVPAAATEFKDLKKSISNSMAASRGCLAKDKVQVYAHRGFRALAPENTMYGFAAGLKTHPDWIDMDVVLTRDGEVMVSHDPILNPDIVRDEHGKFLAESSEALGKASPEEIARYHSKYTVKNLTQRELQRFDVGSLNRKSAYSRFFPDQVSVEGARIPTLREVIRFVKKEAGSKVNFQIEMKTDPAHPESSADPKLFAQAIYKILHEENVVDRAEIQAFDFRCLYELQSLNKEVRTAYLTSR
jgi:glycerophosphoryl diester phosphodiesterase